MARREINNTPTSSATFNNVLQLLDIEDVSKNMREIFDGAVSYDNTGAEVPIEFREAKVKRLMVNQIRHCNSNYNQQLKQIYNIDRSSACQYHLYKNIVLDRIGNACPYLKDECSRQKRKMNMVRVKREVG